MGLVNFRESFKELCANFGCSQKQLSPQLLNNEPIPDKPCRDSPLLECPVSPPPPSGIGMMSHGVTTAPCTTEFLSPEEIITVPIEPEASGCVAEDISTNDSPPDKGIGSDPELPSDSAEEKSSGDLPESNVKVWDGAVCHMCNSAADTLYWKKAGKCMLCLAICFTCKDSISASETQCVETSIDEKELQTTAKKKCKKKRK